MEWTGTAIALATAMMVAITAALLAAIWMVG